MVGIYVFWPYINIYQSIKSLNDHFIKIEIVNDKVNYNFVVDKPEHWVKLQEISKRLQWAIVVSEDGKFFEHNGFDYDQYQEAFKDAFVAKKKKVRGASTITQQLIKNLFLGREKSIFRKVKEFMFSLIIEKQIDKQKILETYLNIIEYGKNIYGIKSASLYYFKKYPSQLSARESAFLAMLLPSPVKYSKSFQNRMLSPFASRIVNSVLLKMNQAGAISLDEYQNQLASTFFWETKRTLDAENSLAISEEDLINEDADE